MIGVVALFTGFAIEAVVVVIVVLVANLWKVCTKLLKLSVIYQNYKFVISSYSKEGKRV